MSNKQIKDFTELTVLADTDKYILQEIGGTTKYTQFTTIKSTLKTYNDGLYHPLLAYTPENAANKSTDGTLAANSTTLYPSQSAVKTYADTKVTGNVAISGATKTKITYDAKGLVTSGADATTADIADSNNKRYVTETEKSVLANTSGTNTGDNPIAGAIEVLDTTDTSCYIAMFEAATGNLTIKTDAGLTYNATTGMLTATGLTGPLNSSNVILPVGLGSPTYDDLQDWMRMTRSAGRLTGGVVSAHAGPNGTVDISEMEGMIFTTNALGGTFVFFKQAAATAGLEVSAGAVSWIYFDWNGGAPRYMQTTDRSTIHEYDQFAVGRVFRYGDAVEVQATGHNIYDMDRQSHNRLILKYGCMDRVSGGIISQRDSLKIQSDAGSWYVANKAFTTPAAIWVKVWYKDGNATWIKGNYVDSFAEVFNGVDKKLYEYYQNGNVLATLGANKYGVYWIFICPDGELYVVMGESDYNNIALAQAATVPASLPSYCVNYARLAGRVICQKTAAAFHSVESAFSQTFTYSAAVDHNSLANLQLAANAITYGHIDDRAQTIYGAKTFNSSIVGNVTGNCSGTAATVTGAAQASITSLGTLTTLTVDNITIDGSSITGISDANTVMTAYAGRAIAIESVTFDGGVVAGITTLTTSDNVAIGTTDMDGTPAIGRLVVKGSTADGTTNCLVLRDSAEANRFLVNTQGNVDIIMLSGAPFIGGKRHNGTEAAKTKVLAGEQIFQFFGSAYQETTPGYNTIASINFAAAEDQTGTAGGSLIFFQTCAIGSVTRTERMRIKDSGVINLSNVPNYTTNTLALAGGLVAGDLYHLNASGDNYVVCIVH